MQTQEKNRLAKAASATIRADIRQQIRAFARGLLRIEAAIAGFVARHPQIAGALGLLPTIPGIGRITALTLLTGMPERGALDRRAGGHS